MFTEHLSARSKSRLVCKIINDSLIYKDTLFEQAIEIASECMKTSDCIYYCAGGGIEEANSLQVQVYPNPTNKIVNLQIDKSVIDVFTIQVFNAQSQLVKKLTSRENYVQLDLEEKGLYFITITSEEGLNYSGKLLVY